MTFYVTVSVKCVYIVQKAVFSWVFPSDAVFLQASLYGCVLHNGTFASGQLIFQKETAKGERCVVVVVRIHFLFFLFVMFSSGFVIVVFCSCLSIRMFCQ